ncbi:MAG: toxin Fic [Parcubacteria group bacterium Athens0714_25]|nr:MAG: toxin Fic [Parcubacteria group bacterium Athens0714_25]
MAQESQNQIIIYEGSDGKARIEVRFEGETAWLTQAQIAQLFGKGRSTIAEKELDEEVVCRDFRLTTEHGAIRGKTQENTVKHYNIDVIISVSYCVKSPQGTRFRQWATARLREYYENGGLGEAS